MRRQDRKTTLDTNGAQSTHPAPPKKVPVQVTKAKVTGDDGQATSPEGRRARVKELNQILREYGRPPIIDEDDLPSDLPDPIDVLQLLDADLPKPAELVHGILHRGSKMVIGGGSKSFKTWSLIDLAISVATGAPWWGFETEQGRVLYVNFEIQDFFFAERIWRVTEAKDRQLDPNQFLYW